MKSLRLMSKTYELFAEYSAEDFEKAASLAAAGSAMATTLQELSRLRRSLGNPGPVRKTPVSRAARVSAVKKPAPATAAKPRGKADPALAVPAAKSAPKGAAKATARAVSDVRGQIETALLDYAVFGNNRDLVACLKEIGVPLQFRYREGRPRIIKKLLRYSEELTATKQQRLIKRLQSYGQSRR